MRMFKKDEGFTLVELMVVVLIIGILVAVAIPVFNAASNTARARNCQSNQRIIESAVQQYIGADPTNSLADVDSAVTDPNPLIVEDYIKEDPECPGDTDHVPAGYTVNADGYTICPSSITSHER